MKKLFLVLGLAMLALVSCDDDDDVAVAYINIVDGYSFTPATVSGNGGAVTIAFTTNFSWQASGYSSFDWFSLDKTSGDAGRGEIVVTVSANSSESGDYREGSFTINAGAATQTVTISQGEGDKIIIDQTTYSIGAAGGTVEVTVRANVDYTVSIPSDVTWVSCVSTKADMETYMAILSVEANTETVARSATVTFTGGGSSVPVTINQDAGNGAAEGDLTMTQVWEKSFSSDLTQISAGQPFRIGIQGSYLLMCNSSEIYTVTASTGDNVSALNFSSASSISPNSMVTDDAGNILVAATAVCSTDSEENFTVYKYDGSSATELLSYPVKNFYGGNMGNLRVAGDVDGDAVVVALVSVCNYFIAWQITGGVVGEPVTGMIEIPESKVYGIADVYYACVCPVSSKLSDGLVYIGYDDAYALKYCAVPTAETPSWSTLWSTGDNGNQNFCNLSVAEFDGRTYCAVGQGGHWSWCNAPYIYLLDITGFTTGEVIYEERFYPDTNNFVNVGEDDVKLVSSANELLLYYVDRGFDFATCMSFTK